MVITSIPAHKYSLQLSLLAQTQAQNSAKIGVISMAMAAPNILDNKALALPNVKNLRRLQLTN